jgi:deoxyxylulose-5-phosphate synthase
MKQNGNPVDLLGSVEMFTEAMHERFGNSKSSLFIIVSDGDMSLLNSFGADDQHIDAISTVIYQNEEVKDIIMNALALAIAAKYKAQYNGIDDSE